MSRTMRRMVRDRAALRRSVEPILALDLRRVIVAHDQIVEVDARIRVEQAFAWLTARPRRDRRLQEPLHRDDG